MPVGNILDTDDPHFIDTDPDGPLTAAGYRQIQVGLTSVDVTGMREKTEEAIRQGMSSPVGYLVRPLSVIEELAGGLGSDVDGMMDPGFARVAEAVVYQPGSRGQSWSDWSADGTGDLGKRWYAVWRKIAEALPTGCRRSPKEESCSHAT